MKKQNHDRSRQWIGFDMSYAVNPTAGGSIRLDGFDANGNLVASQNQTFYTNGVLEDHLTLTAGSTPISSVTVVPTTIAEGFGNIAYQTAAVPEPTFIPLLAGIAFFPRRRCSGSKNGDAARSKNGDAASCFCCRRLAFQSSS